MTDITTTAPEGEDGQVWPTGFGRGDGCQHPTITDEMLVENEALIAKTWGDQPSLKCPDCDEYLYPHGDPADGPDDSRIYVGEPYGAGADPWGRPDPITHPESWTE
jgi:hypothetical protein